MYQGRQSPPRCRTPGCRQEGGHGRYGRFCDACAERLDGIRADLERETSRRFNKKSGDEELHAADGELEPRAA